MAEIVNFDSYYVNGTAYSDEIYNYTFAEISGYGGNDTIATAAFATMVDAGTGDDVIINIANPSMGVIIGGSGNDTIINYGNGNVTMSGGFQEGYETDDDVLVGGTGADCFIVSELGGTDLIVNYDSSDYIMCITSGYVAPPTYFVYGSDVIITGIGLFSIVQNAAYQQFNFGYYTESSDLIATPEPQKALWGGFGKTDDILFGTAETETFLIGKDGGNDLAFNVGQDDTIQLYNATLSDIVATSVSDNSIAIVFNTGEVAQVSATDNVSPTFKLVSGESYVYNRSIGSWQQK